MGHHILVGTDSRGRTLEFFISNVNPFPIGWQSEVHFLPGAPISKISNELLEKLKLLNVESNSKIVVMIAAGICNLTQKTDIEGGGYFLNYEVKTSSERVESVKNDIINSLGAFQEYNVLQKCAMIPPVSLLKISQNFNNNFTDKELIKLAEEQKQLEQDIEILNEFIYKLNTDNSVRTVMWDRDVRKSRIRTRGVKKPHIRRVNIKTVHVYRDLYDGVHPSQFLSSIWYCALCQSIVNDINDKFSDQMAMEENEENRDDIDDSWDFKR